MDFFEQTFGACPHGGIKPYCSQCTGDALVKKRAERRQKRDQDGGKATERHAAALAQVVDNQSVALDAANRRIEALQEQLSQARRGSRLPWRPAR